MYVPVSELLLLYFPPIYSLRPCQKAYELTYADNYLYIILIRSLPDAPLPYILSIIQIEPFSVKLSGIVGTFV